MAQSTIATAADYADAMLIARRARNWVFWLLLVILLGQLALFLVARFTSVLDHLVTPREVKVDAPATPEAIPAPADRPAVVPPTTLPGEGTEVTRIEQPPPAPSAEANWSFRSRLLQYAVGLTGFLGITLAIVLAALLLLILDIMLIGRLIGVSQVTSSLIWCLVLIVFLFPWQAFLNNAGLTAQDFKIPGVLYTWNELTNREWYEATRFDTLVLKWARFAAFPVVAIILLIVTYVRSGRGMRLALGEAELESTPDAE